MHLKFVSAVLVGLLIVVSAAAPARGADRATRDAQKREKLAAKVKLGIQSLGTGPDARVQVQLRDKTKVAGFVASAGEASFAVSDEKTGLATDVPYADVSKVRGNNLATGWKIGIGVGIALAIFLILVATEVIGDGER